MINKKQIGVAADMLYDFITDTKHEKITLEELKNQVIAETNVKCKTLSIAAIQPNATIDWQPIARMAIRKCTDLKPNNFINLTIFCGKNWDITAWLYTICGTKNPTAIEKDYFTSQLMLGFINQLVLSFTEVEKGKEETIAYLIKATNEFFENTKIKGTTKIVDDVLSDIAKTIVDNIKTTAPDMLEGYAKIIDWQINNWSNLAKHAEHMVAIWPAWNTHKKEEKTTATT